MALALAAGGERARARGSMVSAGKSGKVPLTIVSSEHRKKLKSPVKLTFLPPGDAEVRYSLDGADEIVHRAPMEVTKKGRHVVRARAMIQGEKGPEVVTVFTVE
jgi:hypothetical protein